MKYSPRIFIIIISFLALPWAYGFDLPVKYYFKLKFLKSSTAPQAVEMIKIDRLNTGKAVSSRGILFTYKNRSARNVKIAGNFSFWKHRKMERSNHGIWYYFLETAHIDGEITYKFKVDETWTDDPLNDIKEDDKAGSYLSIAVDKPEKQERRISFVRRGRNTIEFRIHAPRASMVSLIGDFNHWNPEHDLLTKQQGGTWTITKKLSPGTHRYIFLVDGKKKPDLYNEVTMTDPAGDICSVVKIAPRQY